MDYYTIIQLLIVAVTATSAMTIFSYAVSKKFRELFKEPVLLSYVLKVMKIELPQNSEFTLGWLLHYIIGLGFVVIYHYLWINDILPISILSTLLLGALTGLTGIVSWMILFKLSNYQPNIDFKGYYIQLFIAHIIFTLVATAVYYISLLF